MDIEKLNKKLLDIAEKGSIKQLIDCLEKGANVNCRSKSDKSTPIMAACARGDMDIIKELLSRGAIPYITNDASKNALDQAIRANHKDVFDLLVSYDNQRKSFDYDSALLSVCKAFYKDYGDYMDYARKLLDIGADPSARSMDGFDQYATPLHDAIHVSLDLVKLLVEHGAKVNVFDKLGRTPFHSAAREKQMSIAEFLAGNGANIDTCDFSFGTTPLMDCVRNKSGADIVHFLVENGADVHVKTIEDETLLMFSPIETMRYLIDHGVDVDAKNKDGHTALHYHVQFNNKDAVNILLNNKADINVQDKVGDTLLMFAYKWDRLTIFQELLSHNPDLTIENNEGKTIMAMLKYGKLDFNEVMNAYLEQKELNNMINSDAHISQSMHF